MKALLPFKSLNALQTVGYKELFDYLENKCTLEEAVKMITLTPAMAWGFNDRGIIRQGAIADINVFNPDTIAPEVPTIVNDLPTGAPRLFQGAEGLHATIVNGAVVLKNGVPTGNLSGRLLRAKIPG